MNGQTVLEDVNRMHPHSLANIIFSTAVLTSSIYTSIIAIFIIFIFRSFNIKSGCLTYTINFQAV